MKIFSDEQKQRETVVRYSKTVPSILKEVLLVN